MTGPYDDIINLPHPTSVKHPRMPLSDRAAQFAPFAALSRPSPASRQTNTFAPHSSARQIEISSRCSFVRLLPQACGSQPMP